MKKIRITMTDYHAINLGKLIQNHADEKNYTFRAILKAVETGESTRLINEDDDNDFIHIEAIDD